MALNLLIIIGACVGGVVFGEFGYLIVVKIRKNLRAKRSDYIEAERRTPATIAEDVGDSTAEQAPDETPGVPDSHGETHSGTANDDWLNSGVPEAPASAIKKEDDDWLNSGVPEASANAIKKEDGDWLNNGVEEVAASVYRQQDDAWLNAEDPRSIESPDGASSDRPTANNRDIQIRQDGPVLSITVAAPREKDDKSEQTVINLKLKLSPQDVAKKGEGPYDVEITTEDSYPSDERLLTESHPLADEIRVSPSEAQYAEGDSLMDEITVRPAEYQVPESRSVIDEIRVQPAEERATESHALMDEISVRPLEDRLSEAYSEIDSEGYSKMDTVYVQPAEVPVNEGHSLMDAISVRPVGTPIVLRPQLMDAEYIRPVQTPVTDRSGLLDEVSIKPSTGPVKIEYELLDDLITKAATRRVKHANLSGDAAIASVSASPVEQAEPFSNAMEARSEASPVESIEPAKTISFGEIAELLKERKNARQAAVPSVAVRSQSPTLSARVSDAMGRLHVPSRSRFEKVELPGAWAQALATLRICNNSRFYIRDTDLTHADALMQEPRLQGFAFKTLETVAELDELIDGGYDLVKNSGRIRRGLEGGTVAFLAFVGRELASFSWACMTEESKQTFKGYPYNDDLDGQACIVGDWTNPTFRGSAISSYVKNKRQQLLREGIHI